MTSDVGVASHPTIAPLAPTLSWDCDHEGACEECEGCNVDWCLTQHEGCRRDCECPPCERDRESDRIPWDDLD